MVGPEKRGGSEWELLLECASPHAEAKKIEELARAVDWQRMLLLAEEHGVEGHVATRVREMDPRIIPEEIRHTLQERHRGQVFSALRMSAEMFQLLERFASEGIEVLVVKGPVLAVQAYGDPAMRSYGDLDMLVRQRDIFRATELMIKAGYKEAVPLSAITAGKIPGQYLFRQLEARLLVELHNDLTLRYFPKRLPLEKYFDRSVRVRVDGHEVPALAAEDCLVLICIHGAKHFWERLMWVADVAALVTLQSKIDWERVEASAREVGAERMVHAGLQLAMKLLKARPPEKVEQAVMADRAAGKLAEQAVPWMESSGEVSAGLLERAAFRMRMRGGWINAPAYLMRLSFSPTEEDWGEGGEKNPGWLREMMRRSIRLARKYRRGGKG
jgi:hypothetical protein